VTGSRSGGFFLRGPARASAQPDLPFQRIPKAAEAADEAD